MRQTIDKIITVSELLNNKISNLNNKASDIPTIEEYEDIENKLNILAQLSGISSSGNSKQSYVRVNRYIPGSEAYSAISSITVTGLGMLLNYDDYQQYDYSKYNGNYIVTQATKNASQQTQMVFKHETENMYVYYGIDTDYDFEGWYISDDPTMLYYYNALLTKSGTELPSGTSSWSTEYNSANLTIIHKNANYPAKQMVLECSTISYDNGWIIGKSINITQYDNQPIKHGIYLVNGNKLINHPIAYYTGHSYINPSGLLMYFPMDQDGGDTAIDVINGNKLVRSSASVMATGTGWECVKNGEYLAGLNTSFKFPKTFTISVRVTPKAINKRTQFAPIFCFGQRRIGNTENSFGLTVSMNSESQTTQQAIYGYRYKDQNSQYNEGHQIHGKSNQQCHYVLTCDGEYFRVYQNGHINETNSNQTDDATYKLPKNINPLMLLFSNMAPNKDYTNSHSSNFIGKISELIMWDRQLSNDDILWLNMHSCEKERVLPTNFTSNTSNEGYIISQDSNGYGSGAFEAFIMNKTKSDYGYCSSNKSISASNPVWFAIQVPVSFIPGAIYYKNQVNSPNNFKSATFQAYDNISQKWIDLVTIHNPDQKGYENIVLVDTNESYKKFRMLFTEAYGSCVSVQAFTIYKK